MVELAGDYEFAAPQELVWQMMLDPDVLARTIPGCEKLERVDQNTFQGRLNLRVGPVQAVLQGKVESSDLQPPNSFHITVSGNGPAGAVRGEGNMSLSANQSSAHTVLRYDGVVHVSGRIASVGQRVMESSARSVVKQSLENLEKQIQAQLQPAPEPDGAAPVTAPLTEPPAPPSQTAFMANLTRDVVADLIRDPQARRLVIGLGVAAVLLGLMNVFANLVARRVTRSLEKEYGLSKARRR